MEFQIGLWIGVKTIISSKTDVIEIREKCRISAESELAHVAAGTHHITMLHVRIHANFVAILTLILLLSCLERLFWRYQRRQHRSTPLVCTVLYVAPSAAGV